jgi:hypothetical protein
MYQIGYGQMMASEVRLMRKNEKESIQVEAEG